MTGRRAASVATRIVVGAPAKINLALSVLGRRPDGYHDVQTVLQSIALCDTVTIRLRRGPLVVRSRSPWVPRDSANLIWPAACGLWQALGRAGGPRDVAISVSKTIPAAAGLGGASSDAAAALRGLSSLWAPRSSRSLLERVAATIGSDVPFFLRGGTVAATGRGERLRSLRPLAPCWVVVAVPRMGVSTASAYGWWDGADRAFKVGQAVMSVRPGLPRGWRSHLEMLRNDLEPVVTRRYPALRAVIAGLRGAGAVHAAMTGSGSAVFGLYRRRATASAARTAVRRAGWRTEIVPTVGPAEYGEIASVTSGPSLASRRRID